MAALSEIVGRRISFTAFSRDRGRRAQPEQVTPPVFSESFLSAQRLQVDLDARLGSLTPTGSLSTLSPGQDHHVQVMPTTQGEYAVKTLRSTSRPYLVFGLGIHPAQVPPDTNQAARQRLVAAHSDRAVDPSEVADMVRLHHTMAMTHLDRGEGLILPTAIVVQDGQINSIQRFLPPFGQMTVFTPNPMELEIERATKADLFATLRTRWERMQRTRDFQILPPLVQSYIQTFPPDHGMGTNAHFFGLGNAVAIDY